MADSLKHFEVTEDHLKLLRAAYLRWDDCEFGAPAIDSKRPYGNSDVVQDIAEILGWRIPDYEDADYEAYWDSVADKARKLHEETLIALQIALCVGEFKTGRYVTEPYRRDWRYEH